MCVVWCVVCAVWCVVTSKHKQIIIHTCPHVDKDGGCDPWFTIEENGRYVYNSKEVNFQAHSRTIPSP